MITDAALPFLTATGMPLRRPLRTTEEGVMPPLRTPTVATVDLRHLLPLSMIDMIEDLMSGTLRTLLPPAAELELLLGLAKTTTEPRRLATMRITVVVRRRLLRRATQTITLGADLRTSQLQDTGAGLRVPLLGRQEVRMTRAIPAATEMAEAFLATAMLVVLRDLGIILPLLPETVAMLLRTLVLTGDRDQLISRFHCLKKYATLQRTIVCPTPLLIASIRSTPGTIECSVYVH